ncbi:Uu.00g027530.m01.CDS01 [Anthostomella pinea]|uniref:Uu.00g027530.m01.CDS01 n=1 Tax=Anthostomella pinea TaxID=933095 RepID=A0AAI8V8R7_9PEZI|nr:Uu.00g027530.m01.CDS01 [Anthostomella pinea]
MFRLSVALLASMLALGAAAKPTHLVVPPRIPRDVRLGKPLGGRVLAKRDANANASFPLDWQAKGETLFSGKWEAFSLSLECVDCPTRGEIVASTSFPDGFADVLDDVTDGLDLFDEAELAIAFYGVGARIELGLTASASGEFALPLFKSESPIGVAGPGFQVGVVFSVDLVLGIKGQVETTGGFEVSIPDVSSFTMPLDTSKENTANFDGAMASLLPLSATVPANVTLALRLRVQAGIDLPSIAAFDTTGSRGRLHQHTAGDALGEQLAFGSGGNDTTTCVPAFAEFNINAGVFVDVGADVAGVDLVDFNPAASTMLFEAVASTCFGGLGEATTTAMTTTGVPCPTALVTETQSAMATYSITSCAAALVNCPASMAQVVVVEEPTVRTVVSCPTAAGSASVSVAAPLYPTMGAPYGNTTTTTAMAYTTPATGAGAGAVVSLTRLTAPVTETLSIAPTVTTPAVATITASALGGFETVTGGASVTGVESVTDVTSDTGVESEVVTTAVVTAASTSMIYSTVTVTAGDCTCSA